MVHLSGHSGHDERFASAMTDAAGRMLQRWPLIKKLKDAVTKATKGKVGDGTKRKPGVKEQAKAWARAYGVKHGGITSIWSFGDVINEAVPTLSEQEAETIAYDVYYDG